MLCIAVLVLVSSSVSGVSSSVYRYQSDQAILYDISPIIVMSAYTCTVEYYDCCIILLPQNELLKQ